MDEVSDLKKSRHYKVRKLSLTLFLVITTSTSTHRHLHVCAPYTHCGGGSSVGSPDGPWMVEKSQF